MIGQIQPFQFSRNNLSFRKITASTEKLYEWQGACGPQKNTLMIWGLFASCSKKLDRFHHEIVLLPPILTALSTKWDQNWISECFPSCGTFTTTSINPTILNHENS